MPPVAVMGSQLMCTGCPAPGTLIVLPANKVMVNGQPVANIQDAKPIVNIPPFPGPCAFTPLPPSPSGGPCIPKTTMWTPGKPTVMLGGQPVVTQTSKAICGSGGMISVIMTPATTVQA